MTPNADALADTRTSTWPPSRAVPERNAAIAAARQVFLAYEMQPGRVLIGDPDALRRAVGNLLANAVRLSPDGGTVTVATGRIDGWLWLAVDDEGPGTAADDQARAFDRFWRGPAGGRDRRTGLGLAIVRQITESHGGAVAVFSTPGTGSTFVLWLPPIDRADDTPPPLTSPLRSSRATRSGTSGTSPHQRDGVPPAGHGGTPRPWRHR
jgi:signal transduction histidine kinase